MSNITYWNHHIKSAYEQGLFVEHSWDSLRAYTSLQCVPLREMKDPFFRPEKVSRLRKHEIREVSWIGLAVQGGRKSSHSQTAWLEEPKFKARSSKANTVQLRMRGVWVGSGEEFPEKSEVQQWAQLDSARGVLSTAPLGISVKFKWGKPPRCW